MHDTNGQTLSRQGWVKAAAGRDLLRPLREALEGAQAGGAVRGPAALHAKAARKEAALRAARLADAAHHGRAAAAAPLLLARLEDASLEASMRCIAGPSPRAAGPRAAALATGVPLFSFLLESAPWVMGKRKNLGKRMSCRWRGASRGRRPAGPRAAALLRGRVQNMFPDADLRAAGNKTHRAENHNRRIENFNGCAAFGT